MRAAIWCFLLSASAVNGHNLTDPNEFELIAAAVNAAEAGWTADPNTARLFPSLSHVKALCGAWLKDDPRRSDVKLAEYNPIPVATVPSAFSPLTQWPKCAIMAKVRNQAGCGSCWAFGSTESFEGRRCIATGADVEFSTDDTASCSQSSNGCGGGEATVANQWFVTNGVVTGAGYHQDVGCMSYVCAPCTKGLYPPLCPEGQCSSKLKCHNQCTNKDYTKSYSEDKTKALSSFSVSSVDNIMNALMTSGPLSCAFTVFADFPTYTSGVYVHTHGGVLGGHAVLILGWGVEDSKDYWQIKNSWSPAWGNKGFFKILKGKNECGIESDVSGTMFNSTTAIEETIVV